MSKVSKRYLNVKGIKKVPKGPRYPRVTRVQDIQNVPKGPRSKVQMVSEGPRYPIGTLRSNVSKSYIKVQCIKKVLRGQRYPKGT